MKMMKTQFSRIKTVAVLTAAMAALTGCSFLNESGLGDGARYIGNGIAEGYRTVQDWETASVGAMRSSHFGDARAKTAPSVKLSAKSLYLKTYGDGEGFSARTLDEANAFLSSQGPIGKQVLTIVPLSENGIRVAKRLAQALEEAGADTPRLARYVEENAQGQEQFADRQTGWDIELISEAYVLSVSDCGAANGRRMGIDPYYAVGALGCANNANIALMVSDPKDLLRGRPLEAADGTAATLAVQKYQTGDTEDLVDIDFSQDE